MLSYQTMCNVVKEIKTNEHNHIKEMKPNNA